MTSVILSNLQIDEYPARTGSPFTSAGNPHVISMSADIIINTNDINDQQFFYEVKNSQNEIIAMQIHPQDHKIKPNTKVTIGIPQVFRTTDGNYRLNAWSVSSWTGRRFDWASHTGIKEYERTSNVASISEKVSRIVHGTDFDRTRGQQTQTTEQTIVTGTKPFEKPARQKVFNTVREIEQAYQFFPEAAAEVNKELSSSGLSLKTRKIIDDWAVKKIIVPSWFANNNMNWVLSGHITESEFLAGYNNLVNTGVITFSNGPQTEITIVESPSILLDQDIIFTPIPEVSAVPDTINEKVTTNMVKQEILNFTIVDNRIQGTIKFTATNTFNPYYYNKTITNYLQLKSNGKVLKIKTNTLRFTEKERDEIINFDESAFDLVLIDVESYVWTSTHSALSNKLQFSIQQGTQPKEQHSGLMGAGVVGAIGILILLGVMADKMRKTK